MPRPICAKGKRLLILVAKDENEGWENDILLLQETLKRKSQCRAKMGERGRGISKLKKPLS